MADWYFTHSWRLSTKNWTMLLMRPAPYNYDSEYMRARFSKYCSPCGQTTMMQDLPTHSTVYEGGLYTCIEFTDLHKLSDSDFYMLYANNTINISDILKHTIFRTSQKHCCLHSTELFIQDVAMILKVQDGLNCCRSYWSSLTLISV